MNNQRSNLINKCYKLGQRRCYCGVQLVYNSGQTNSATYEHLVTKKCGGTHALANGIMVCRSCNNKRGDACWVDWVLENNLPNRDWLLKKYIGSVKYYKHRNRVVSVKGFKDIKSYINDKVIEHIKE